MAFHLMHASYTMSVYMQPVVFPVLMYILRVNHLLQTPDTGTVERGNTVRLGLVAQLRSDLNANKTVYEVGTRPSRHPHIASLPPPHCF